MKQGLCLMLVVLLVACTGPKVPKAGPGPQIMMAPEALQDQRPGQELLRSWVRGKPETIVVWTERDRMSNGLAAAMSPFLVDWSNSDEQGWIVHNVELAASPVKGTVLFGSVRIPKDAVERVEWLLIRDRTKKGKLTKMGHGQLRVVFKEGQPVEVISRPLPLNTLPEIPDLVFSFEAWRPPGSSYSIFEGLDAEKYSLTVRCYAGPSRFLRDSVNGKPWDCYPLDIDWLDGAEEDLLETCLIMGDGIARRSIPEGTELPVLSGLRKKQAEQIREGLSLEQMPQLPLSDWVQQTDSSYHLIQRSCITMALTAIDLSLDRTAHRLGLERERHLNLVPEQVPDWLNELPHRGTSFMILHGPAALSFISREKQVLPGNSYMILEEAKLLQLQENGKPLIYRYDPKAKNSPYGDIRRMNMM